MVERWYTVTLQSDVSITANAATTGGHVGLDYLPGSLFLGAAVARSLSEGRRFDPECFLSGRIRFFDSFPAAGEDSTFPIPLCFHKIKGQEWEKKKPLNLLTEATRFDGQPKQWRQGFMSHDGRVVDVKKNSRMKTAIDRESGRSAEGKLFGCESIVKGTKFFLKVQADFDDDLDFVDSLIAERELRLGRSRSAEYGIVSVQKCSLRHPEKLPQKRDDGEVVLYLLSDLALVRNGMSTLLPHADDFGLKNASLVPEKCFMRSRSYSPWNAFFNCRMMERNVLCKGSVITFKLEAQEDVELLQRNLDGGIGLFREEGLGQILVNPHWLLEPPVLQKADVSDCRNVDEPSEPETSLIAFLKEKTQLRRNSRNALESGLQWANDWFKLSESIARTGQMVPGKSQWSAIRGLADRYAGDRKSLLKSLEEFCTNGMRKKKWLSVIRKSGKETCLYEKIREQIEIPLEENEKTPDEYTILTLHHAAVEMGRMLARAAEKKGRVRSR